MILPNALSSKFPNIGQQAY
jgi:hypothetical protein